MPCAFVSFENHARYGWRVVVSCPISASYWQQPAGTTMSGVDVSVP